MLPAIRANNMTNENLLKEIEVSRLTEYPLDYTRVDIYRFRTNLGVKDIEHPSYCGTRGKTQRTFSKITLKDVPRIVMRDFEVFSGICPYETEERKEYLTYLEEKRVEDERKRIEEELKAQDIHRQALETNTDEIIEIIQKFWDGVTSNEKKEEIFSGFTLKGNLGLSRRFYKIVKIQAKAIGFSFSIETRDEKYNISNLLQTSFRFALEVCRMGDKVSHKGIVLSLAKKEGRPNIKTLKENGFNIDNKVLQSLDLNSLDGVKTLFESYESSIA